MIKKASIYGLGLALLVSPIFVSADVISDIQAQIKNLLAQIAALKTAPSNPTGAGTCPSITRSLIIGSSDSLRDDEVSRLQQFLTDQGMYTGPVTGYYGNLTAQAVVRWQKAHGMDFVTLKSGVGPMTRAKINASCASVGTAPMSWKIYITREFQISYPDRIFTAVPVQKYIFGQGTTRYSGIKLVDAARVSKFGTAQCAYGLSGLSSVCSAEGDPGISFVVVATSSKKLTDVIDSASKQQVMFAGTSGVLVHGEAEGDGSYTYFLPLSETATLVVEWEFLYGFQIPSQAQFDGIISTLKIY